MRALPLQTLRLLLRLSAALALAAPLPTSLLAQTIRQSADLRGSAAGESSTGGVVSAAPRQRTGPPRRAEDSDMIRRRFAFRLLQERDEDGRIPADAIPRAVMQMNASRVRAPRARVAGVPVVLPPGAPGVRLFPRTAGLQNNRWTALGPGNIGGRIRSIVIHPARPATMWVGSVGGGIWRTDNGGRRFAPVDDLMANLAVSCMVMDPTNAQVIYAGTGEGYNNVDSIRGAGIFKTVDGRRWQRLPSTATPEFQYVTRLSVSADGASLLASTAPTYDPETNRVVTQGGVFRSPDRGATFARATVDSGGTQVPFNAALSDVDFHPTDRLKAVAGGFGGDAYYTEDGGRTWKRVPAILGGRGRIEVAYARANPLVVYASVDADGGRIWKSTDGGKTYTPTRSAQADGRPALYFQFDEDSEGGQGWYDNALWAEDPTNARLVVVGGIDLWKSTDGGETLARISQAYDVELAPSDPRPVHSDHHAIVAHPGYNGTTNKTVFFGNDGGVYRADNISTVGSDPKRLRGWTRLVNALSTTQFYGGAGNPSTGIIFGGTQDNGTLRYTPSGGTEAWAEVFGGDGGWCAADPTDPKVFYGERPGLEISRSTDGGATPDRFTGGDYDRDITSGYFGVWDHRNGRMQWMEKPAPYRIEDAREGKALFVAPFIIDPNNPNRLLAGGASLWRTDDAKTPNTRDRGPAWASVKPPTRALISTIAVAKGNSDIVWVGHADGEIYKTTNGTAARPTWERVGRGVLPARRYSHRIAFDPRDPRVVYATFGGYKRGNVWKTTDGGATWRNLGETLPEAPVRVATVHPKRSSYVYVGTEVGLFASEDGGATWSPTNEGPTNCSVEELFWMGDTLVAVTHGRGMFKINLPL